jgi:uncharacterized protein YodC (DUF2158 family)
MSFKVGDTVELKSGGPDMTVTRIGAAGGEPMVWCVWFEGTKDLYGLFPPETLKAPSELTEPDKAPSEPEALKPPLEPAETLEAPREQQPTEVEGAPLTPEPAEASQEPHPTQPDSVPLAAKSDIQAQIVSIQSMISSLLKRPVDRTG